MTDLSIPRDEQFWVNSKEEVQTALRSLYYANSLLTLFYKNTFCLSNVVSYNDDYVWLDSCSNEKDNEFLIKQPQVYLKAQAASVPLFMELENGKIVNFNERPTWQFKLPSRVHKMQRRDSFRVTLPALLENTIKIKGSDLTFKIIDISLTGVGLLTEKDVNLILNAKYFIDINVEEYQTLPQLKISTYVIVKYISQLANGKKKVGLEFYHFDKQQQILLTKWQTKMQINLSIFYDKPL